MKELGHFKNGDKWNGDKYEENGIWYFGAIDNQGRIYETSEIPETPPLFTLIRFDDGTPEQEVIEYIKRNVRA